MQGDALVKEQMQMLMTWKDTIIDFFIRYGFQLLGAAIILAIGALVARWAGRVAERWLGKQPIEPPVRLLLVRVLRLLIMAMVLILVLDKMGVQITPLIAGIGVAGAGLALALQGVLSNLAAGLTIIFTKPFRVGEYIDLLGEEGEVKVIDLFATTLVHPDHSRVVIPNRKIVGEILHNYGKVRQLDLKVGVTYDAHLKQVFATIHAVLAASPFVIKDPPPVVGVVELAESAITISVQPWVAVADYIPARAELYEKVIQAFRDQGIGIPFPQREVRMLNGGLTRPAA
jgi:small conductance mechanosensitive channel